MSIRETALLEGVESAQPKVLRNPLIVAAPVLFFFSGFPALLYQIVWQRSLFAIFGINIESVTIVVSSFMLGLGLGSLVGGRVSKYPGLPLLAVFGLVELGIAAFGLISLEVFHRTAIVTAGASTVSTALLTFILVLIPTLLMGATLPLLVAHIVSVSKNVGRSVGILYAVNTLGSALACFMAGKFLMRLLGQSGTIRLAFCINLAIALAALGLYAVYGRRSSVATGRAEEPMPHDAMAAGNPSYWVLAVAVAGIAGFVSLSYEILWFRTYSFVSGSEAKSFAYLLGAYLVGIAGGSLFARLLCHERIEEKAFLRKLAFFAVAANVLGFAVIPSVAVAVQVVRYPLTFPLVALAAALLGAIFPLVCHLAVRPDARVGVRLSYLYLANIIGSTLGSFVTGFILMDYWSLPQISVLLAAVGVAFGFALLLPTLSRRGRLVVTAVVAFALVGVFPAAARPLFAQVWERLQYKHDFNPQHRFTDVIETKNGVITVSADRTVFGGGVYDGRFNIDLRHDTNGIFRAYALSSFHASPRRVLMIGLSTGSWAQVIAHHPQLERMTIVEINPGYLDLIAAVPEVASVLRNPKINTVIDDGRRWLLRNRSEKFDVIVMNTTFHWRAHATELLSREFLEIARQHLNQGGVLYYNTTASAEVQLTGLTVYPHGLRVAQCLAVSDSPIVVDKERWRSVLAAYKIEGRPVLDLTVEADRRRFEQVLGLVDTLASPDPTANIAMEHGESLRKRIAGARIVTEDNMGTEWLE